MIEKFFLILINAMAVIWMSGCGGGTIEGKCCATFTKKIIPKDVPTWDTPAEPLLSGEVVIKTTTTCPEQPVCQDECQSDCGGCDTHGCGSVAETEGCVTLVQYTATVNNAPDGALLALRRGTETVLGSDFVQNQDGTFSADVEVPKEDSSSWEVIIIINRDDYQNSMNPESYMNSYITLDLES